MDKANEISIDALKQILTLASATLALTITFLKDVVGAKAPESLWLLTVGWLFLIICIWVSWMTIVAAADSLAAPNGVQKHAFARDERGTKTNLLLRILSWFIYIIPTRELNMVRKMGAAAQNYFVFGLFLVGCFAVINFPSSRENKMIENPPTQTSATDIWTSGNGEYFVLSDATSVSLWQVITPSESRKGRLILLDSQRRENRVGK